MAEPADAPFERALHPEGHYAHFSTVMRYGKRVIVRTPADPYFLEHLGDEHCAFGCTKEIIEGQECSTVDRAARACYTYDEWNPLDFQSWEDAVAWALGDDTKGCNCDSECRCDAGVDDGWQDRCTCVCPEHPNGSTSPIAVRVD